MQDENIEKKNNELETISNNLQTSSSDLPENQENEITNQEKAILLEPPMEQSTSVDSEKKNKTDKKTELSKGAKQGLFVFAGLLLVSLIFSLIVFFSSDAQPKITPNVNFSINTGNTKEKLRPVLKGDAIAVIHIEGVIQAENATYNQAWLLETIENITENDNYVGIMLYINSPGGGVYESDEVYLALEEYKKATEKPVWAYFGPMAASGGYYIGCSANTIYANRNTLTGSIGVIFGQSIDLTELMQKYGIKMTTTTAGRNKNMMNIDSPVTEEHKAIMQSIADECYDQFTSIVAESRDISLEKTRELADGRIYTAKQALSHDLIDNIASFETALEDMKATFEDKDVTEEHFEYELSMDFSNFFFNMMSSIEGTSAETQALEMIQEEIALPKGMEFPAYYYR